MYKVPAYYLQIFWMTSYFTVLCYYFCLSCKVIQKKLNWWWPVKIQQTINKTNLPTCPFKSYALLLVFHLRKQIPSTKLTAGRDTKLCFNWYKIMFHLQCTLKSVLMFFSWHTLCFYWRIKQNTKMVSVTPSLFQHFWIQDVHRKHTKMLM